MIELGTTELIQRLSIALAIGLLIGLERGWRTREEAEGERAAGLRTHGLSALLGGVWGALAQTAGGAGVVALALVFVLVGGVISVFRYRETLRDRTFGATTVVAVMLCFALGALAVLGDPVAAGAAAVATAAMLALKEFLHNLVRAITWPELRSGLGLLAMSSILLPVLPNRDIDPWGSINPAQLWLMTVLIGAVSFAGYVAVKLVGFRRGVAVAGFAGGLASSTATTAEMSRLARQHPEEVNASAAAAIFASMMMSPRVLAVTGVINLALAARLAPALLPATLVFAAGGALLMRRAAAKRGEGDDPQGLAGRNPLDFVAVLKFGALLATVMILSRIATHFAGSAGAYVLALASGVADVDAIALTMARLGESEIGQDAAATAVLLALLSNTIAKSGIAFTIGGAGMGARFAAISMLAVAVALLAFRLVPPLDLAALAPKS